MSWPILSTITFLPLLGALLIVLLHGNDESVTRNARYIALWTTLVTLGLSLLLWRAFDPTTAQFQFLEERAWLGTIKYRMGVDGISMPFVVLTAFLMPLCILASWTSITTRVKEYMIAFLVLETLMLGVFTSLDLVLFYLFLEGGLIGGFLIISAVVGDAIRRARVAFPLDAADAAADPARSTAPACGGAATGGHAAVHALVVRPLSEHRASELRRDGAARIRARAGRSRLSARFACHLGGHVPRGGISRQAMNSTDRGLNT